MKKLLSTIACGAILATTASADFARVEGAVGSWMQTPSGSAGYSLAGNSLSDNFVEDQTNGIYVWALVKHPIPVVPNLRLEYVNITGDAKSVLSSNIITLPLGTSSALDMTQFDIVPYYNILDNLAWITLDLGLDFKVINLSYKANSIEVVPSDVSTLVVPLGYVRGRVQIPFSGIGFESDVKYITYDTTTVYDVRAKVDYTLGFIPIVQPTIELGYRMQKIDISDSGFSIDTEFSGVFVGIGARF